MHCRGEGLPLHRKVRWGSRVPVQYLVKTQWTCRCGSAQEVGDWGFAQAPLPHLHPHQPERKIGLGGLCCTWPCAYFACVYVGVDKGSSLLRVCVYICIFKVHTQPCYSLGLESGPAVAMSGRLGEETLCVLRFLRI